MQAAAFHATRATHAPSLPPSADPVRASVAHLLSRACSLPCTAAAQAFTQLVQPTARFQLALDALLPILSGHAELPQRILVSFILYSLYASHPVTINPFRTVFAEVFLRERDHAQSEADHGGASENEQLVWVLWKILKGDGNDLGPYSPITLARSPLPPKLRATQLTFEEDPLLEEFVDELDHPDHSTSTTSVNGNGSSVSASRNSFAHSKDGNSTPNDYDSRHITAEEDARNDAIAQGMNLLLAARSRILTLSEQRVVAAVLHNFNSPPIITAEDLPTLISFNPTLGHPLIVTLLSQPSTQPNQHSANAYLDVLKQLPPALPSFDILGRLLRDPTPVADPETHGRTTVADLVRNDVLGAFILNAIGWVERVEEDEKQGLISDDRAAKSVQNLCRFYNSLIKLDIIDPASDADSTEMAHFALNRSRFEEANALYRVLVMGKF